MTKWESVKNSFPTKNNEVLILYNNNEIEICRYNGEHWEYFNQEFGEWDYNNNENLITHWMSLPKPPKQK